MLLWHTLNLTLALLASFAAGAALAWFLALAPDDDEDEDDLGDDWPDDPTPSDDPDDALPLPTYSAPARPDQHRWAQRTQAAHYHEDRAVGPISYELLLTPGATLFVGECKQCGRPRAVNALPRSATTALLAEACGAFPGDLLTPGMAWVQPCPGCGATQAEVV
jgi:hypothetical protein